MVGQSNLDYGPIRNRGPSANHNPCTIMVFFDVRNHSKILDGKQYHLHHQHLIVILSVVCVKVGAILCLMSLNLNGILTEVQLKQKRLALLLTTQLVTQVRVRKITKKSTNYGPLNTPSGTFTCQRTRF